MTDVDYLAEARLGTRIADVVGLRLSDLCQDEEHATGTQVNVPRRRELTEELIDKELAAVAGQALSRAEAMLEPAAEARVAQWVRDRLFGHGGLDHYLREESVEGIDVNGHANVWLTFADGRCERGDRPVAASDEDLIALVQDLASSRGTDARRFDVSVPSVNLQLRDGSRLFAAAHGICTVPTVSIRRHRHQRVTLNDLHQLGTVDAGLKEFLAAAVRGRLNILIAGGPAAGKTTMLRALAAEIPHTQRVITVEDTYELALDQDPNRQGNVTVYQTREANTEDVGGIDMTYLMRCTLRGSPKRVIVGEVRGPEIVSMCNAMSMGIDGSLATIHASTSAGVFDKLATYAAQGPERMTREATNLMVASAVDLVVLLAESRNGTRVVSSIRELTEADGPQIMSNQIWAPDADRRARFSVYPSDHTREALESGGFDEAWFTAEGWEPMP
ncbi:CpaF family protein [Catenulispora pinisilvae]|uniref:CpaF family protein n=1 Tax=Catenulispora pinisilvae TaxID=2705253 RepID=UPI001891B6DA|nr:ATPase, T2SS/T4P/T4SS family [Catenulispora pinisilvae]